MDHVNTFEEEPPDMDTGASRVHEMNTPGRSTAGFQCINDDASVGTPDSDGVSEEDMDPSMDQDIPVPEISTPPNTVASLPEVSLEIQKDFLSRIHEQVAMRFPNLCFAMSRVTVDSKEVPVLTICQRRLPPHGMVSRIQGFVQYKEYTVHVMMRLWRRQSFEDADDIIALCKIIDGSSHYKYCPGIDHNLYMKEYREVFRFHSKSVRYTNFPFLRVDSPKCDLLFELAHNATREEKDAVEVKCYQCKRVVGYLNRQRKRTLEETPTRKAKRQRPSSRAKLSYMSPASQAKRKKLAQYDRTNNIRKLARYEDHEITLDDSQNEEMLTVMKKIGDEELQKLCDEGEKDGVGGIIKDIWTTDLDRQRKEFSQDRPPTVSRLCI